MKSYKLIFLLSLVTIFLVNLAIAQKTVERSVDGFSKIYVNTAASVVLQQGKQPQITLELENIEASDVLTVVENQTLKISLSQAQERALQKACHTTYKIKCTITYTTELNEIKLHGACNLKTTDLIKVPDFKVDINGASHALLRIEAQQVHIQINGASSIQLEGKANILYADVNGASSLQALGLVSENCEISAAGASHAKVNTTQSLTAQALGLSSLMYKGNPKQKILHSAGISKIKALN